LKSEQGNDRRRRALSGILAGNKNICETLSQRPKTSKILQEICREVLGRNIGVRLAVKEPDSSDGGPPSELELERQERQRLRAICRRKSHGYNMR